MRIIVLSTREDQEKGLRGMRPIPADTFFIFPGLRPGDRMTAAGVLESFDIAFLTKDYEVLSTWQMDPGNDTVTIPAGAAIAVETRPMTGFMPSDLKRIKRALSGEAR